MTGRKRDSNAPPVLTRNQEIAALKEESRSFKFGFILKGRDAEVVCISCDYGSLKFIMDSVETRPDFMRWFPSRETIEDRADKLYGERLTRHRVREN